MNAINAGKYPTLYADAWNEDIDCGGSPYRQCVACGAQAGRACRRELQRVKMDNLLYQERTGRHTAAERFAKIQEDEIRAEARRLQNPPEPERYVHEAPVKVPKLELLSAKLDRFYGFIKYVFK